MVFSISNIYEFQPSNMWNRRDLSLAARKEFTDAVTCLQSLPTNISADVKKTFQGVQSRYDEFVATHINLTQYIHVTVSVNPWAEVELCFGRLESALTWLFSG